MMKHIMEASSWMLKLREQERYEKIVMDLSASTETYLAHNFPDKAVSMATPVGLLCYDVHIRLAAWIY